MAVMTPLTSTTASTPPKPPSIVGADEVGISSVGKYTAGKVRRSLLQSADPGAEGAFHIGQIVCEIGWDLKRGKRGYRRLGHPPAQMPAQPPPPEASTEQG